MRLQAEGSPNPTDGHAAQPSGFGQPARAPVRLPARRTLQGLHHNLLHLVSVDFARRSRSRLVVEPSRRVLRNRNRHLPIMPSEHRSFFRHRFMVEPLVAGQHYARPPGPDRFPPDVDGCFDASQRRAQPPNAITWSFFPSLKTLFTKTQSISHVVSMSWITSPVDRFSGDHLWPL
jgi:hypothetical protein